MIKNEKQKIVLSVINAHAHIMTRNEIYDAMDPDEQGHFRGVDDISQVLDYLKNKKGFVENGVSEIVNGKSVLTWALTKTGKQAVNNDKADVIDDGISVNQPVLHNSQAAENAEDDSNSAADTGNQPINQGADPVKVGLMLNENRYYANSAIISNAEQAMDTILSAMRLVLTRTEPRAIERKELKIDTLKRIGALLSDDINAVFEEIIDDLTAIDGLSA